MIGAVLRFLFPLAPYASWEVVDDDARGPRITRWNLSDPQPTPEEIAAVSASSAFQNWLAMHGGDALATAKEEAKAQTSTGLDPSHLVQRAIVGLMIDQVNVLRTKVGLATVTAVQVKVALDAKIASLS